MRRMSSNALEYKSLVREGTRYSTRLVVSYTHGAQQIFDKVQTRRAEIQSICSQMQVEKKASATAATGKAVVDLTEREDENGNHMNMKIIQIVNDRLNSRTANSVTLAAKKEARKVATEQVDRRVKCILKQFGIKAEIQALPEGEPPSNSNQNPEPTPTPNPVTTHYSKDASNKRKRESDRQCGSNNKKGNNKTNGNASYKGSKNGNDNVGNSNDGGSYGIVNKNGNNNANANGNTNYSKINNYDHNATVWLLLV
jgi:hypothetical protein